MGKSFEILMNSAIQTLGEGFPNGPRTGDFERVESP